MSALIIKENMCTESRKYILLLHSSQKEGFIHPYAPCSQRSDCTLLCRKIYFDDLKAENIPAEIMEQMYSKDDPHRMYIGEVVEIL